ncbi:formimidoylglutamase [Aquimarina sp. W85]|uniref:formimidoylglutamase n=1 Tax=Aquimarina rhodophyticola TaxID=3342246 RepID=UPI00366B84D3
MINNMNPSFQNYEKTDVSVYTGRVSEHKNYLHEKIICIDVITQNLITNQSQSYALMGYNCDEGVRRNKGRIGATNGSIAVRKVLGTLANHLPTNTQLFDLGNIKCVNQNLEQAQDEMTALLSFTLSKNIFPLVIGGGHDVSFAHYRAIEHKYPDKKIGIINFDAHFDLRNIENQGNSGTPFYQISNLTKNFQYLCLGINRASNTKELFKTADKLKVQYIEDHEFNLYNLHSIQNVLNTFINSVDHVYLTIDMDGFSAAYSPGVSAPSSLGFSTDIVLATLKIICDSKKIISADIVEFNPIYDQDNRTAKLVAQLVLFILQQLENN